MDAFGDAAVGINVVNRADGNDIFSGSFQAVKQGFSKRFGGEVAAAGGAREGTGFFTDERPGNNAADVVGFDQFIGNFTEGVKSVQAEAGGIFRPYFPLFPKR